MRRRRIAFAVAGISLVGIYLFNASWLAPVPTGDPKLLAHRGVHQTFKLESLTASTCTAKRMNPPTNSYLENTMPSIQASFAKGADIIELDVHPTTDGEFAVFHDWGLECRTDGKGVTRRQSMVYLKRLDLGYGYTADGGNTFPFRGKGIGMMPTLNEVLTAYSDKTFLINIKSRDSNEARRLVAYLAKRGYPTDNGLWVFADGPPYRELRKLAPKARVDSKQSVKSCTIQYLALGWTGHVPDACKNGSIGLPTNIRWFFWGWPNRFIDRMEKAGVNMMMVGPLGQDETGVSEVDQLDAVPNGFPGTVMTDHVEVIGPDMKRRGL